MPSPGAGGDQTAETSEKGIGRNIQRVWRGLAVPLTGQTAEALHTWPSQETAGRGPLPTGTESLFGALD